MKAGVMHTVQCTCGSVLQRTDEEALYSAVRGHVDRMHPERHVPLTTSRSTSTEHPLSHVQVVREERCLGSTESAAYEHAGRREL